MHRLIRLRIFLAGALAGISAMTSVNANDLLSRAEIRTFIDEMAAKHDFDKGELKRIFTNVEPLPSVIERITRPAEALPWHKYREIFVQESRIEQGLAFWDANEEALARAEKKYGVPAFIIVAILGVETRYGQHEGGFRIVDSLTTLAFDYPRRGSFFRKELEQFLLLARDEGFDALKLTGSYAGAMGKPQFIASSYRQYAVDFDGDGKRDLLNSNADAIGSVANYFKRHGWRAGEPITYRASVTGNRHKKLVAKGIKPHLRVDRLGEYGVAVKSALPAKTSGALIELEKESGYEYWVGLQNFYAITRYNHSALYAMAVYQLGSEIKKRRETQRIATSD